MPQIMYTDGGIIGSNPSALGGVWAYVLVDADADAAIREASGQISPTAAGMDLIENNLAETWAGTVALESLPRGWSGCVVMDNLNALRRLREPNTAEMGGVPQFLIDRLQRQRARLGVLEFMLVAGHPTRKDLARGFKLPRPGETQGRPVSKWNRHCDELCKAAKRVFDPNY